MSWEIEYTDEFGQWWDSLNEEEQASINAYVSVLEEKGVHLTFPYCSGISESKFEEMRELRVQHKGDPYRVLYAFDPRRCALLLIGGNKKGDERWYKKYIPIAEKLFEKHLKSLKKEK